MSTNFFSWSINKWVGYKRRSQVVEAERFTRQHTPELSAAYQFFQKNGQSGSPRQPWKGRDLWRLLEIAKPSYIAEMGSGTTSAVFSLWALRNYARYVSYEHHEGWAGITRASLKQAGLLSYRTEIRLVPSRLNTTLLTTGFVEDIPRGVDFVYIDGPPCKLANGRKVPNDDIIRHIENGGRPNAIVVDGRTETVDLILDHEVSNNYVFYPSLVYCLRNRHWKHGLRGEEHSTFLLR